MRKIDFVPGNQLEGEHKEAPLFASRLTHNIFARSSTLYSGAVMDSKFQQEVQLLIEENREQALWSFASDFEPSTPQSIRRVLEAIASRGDRKTWVRARQLLRELDVSVRS
ncbi:hypothetical protein IAD21_04172 [Abditibacteriota bacterium]|nr:hypothetical protein IAD21_04172 [Abditibacteriota bacterium]